MTTKQTPIGYFVDDNGNSRTTEKAPDGCHFAYKDKPTYREVWIVSDNSGEVMEEYVLWPSLEALSAAGVDVSCFDKLSKSSNVVDNADVQSRPRKMRT